MKGLSSLERTILECIGNKQLTYFEIQNQTGIKENVCFNILQALIIRNLLSTNGQEYRLSSSLSPLMMEEINGHDAKLLESLELIEALVEQKHDRIFRLKKIAMDDRDSKIFLAMLSNIDSFLEDAHKKAELSIPLKDRKVIFWGVSDIKGLMSQIVTGN